MTGLLVSVRDGTEAAGVVSAGVDLVDVKEPAAGSLGAAEAGVWKQVVELAAGTMPVSLALGELTDQALPGRLADIPAGVRYAKIGLAGCQDRPGWEKRWGEALERLPAGTTPVAVIYADQQRARSPSPAEIMEAARNLGCSAVLVDTFDKHAGNLLDHWSLERVRQHAGQVRQQGMKVVLAGSLQVAEIRLLATPAVDLLAVRGAVCRGRREGQLDPERVARLVELVHQSVAAGPVPG
ncbi:MAG: (5-formylfuran-3-yl)methyl phosphate synthase [Planctomycetota bacterium]|nr:(5-formylfuran-3-yl)methyl phosphate synthase [Planctomycetota bacterium]